MNREPGKRAEGTGKEWTGGAEKQDRIRMGKAEIKQKLGERWEEAQGEAGGTRGGWGAET